MLEVNDRQRLILAENKATSISESLNQHERGLAGKEIRAAVIKEGKDLVFISAGNENLAEMEIKLNKLWAAISPLGRFPVLLEGEEKGYFELYQAMENAALWMDEFSKTRSEKGFRKRFLDHAQEYVSDITNTVFLRVSAGVRDVGGGFPVGSQGSVSATDTTKTVPPGACGESVAGILKSTK